MNRIMVRENDLHKNLFKTFIKERIFGAVSIISKEKANHLWNIIISTFTHRSWDDIPEAEPDAWDIEMLKSIEEDPDCKKFISDEELLAELKEVNEERND